MLVLDDWIFTKYYYSHENKENEMVRQVAVIGSELCLLNWSRITWKYERAGPDQDRNGRAKFLS